MNSKMKKVAGVAFIIAATIFIVAGIIIMIQGNSLKQKCTEKTTGTVVGIISERNYGSSAHTYSYTYYPVIEYKAGDSTITQKSNSGQNPPKYKIGQQLEIYYNPNNVEEYFINDDSTSLIIGIGFIVLGLVAVAVGYFAFIKNADKEKQSEM